MPGVCSGNNNTHDYRCHAVAGQKCNFVSTHHYDGTSCSQRRRKLRKSRGANNYLLIIGVYCVHRSAGLRDLLY